MANRIRRTPEEARNTILKAAEEQVRKDGPDGFRLTDVAERAGMHQSNLLHHFGSREALLQAVASRAFERGAARAIQALGEGLSARPEDRVETLAKVFDSVQQEGTGRLYAWLILSGRMTESNAPDFEPLIQTMRNWRRAMFGSALDAQSDEDLRQSLLLSAIVWLGEAVAGPLFSRVLQLGEEQDAQKRFHRVLAGMMVAWLENESERLRAIPPHAQAQAAEPLL